MDEDTTDAAWAQQEQEERAQRETEALRSARRAQAELNDLNREAVQITRDFDRIFKTRHAPHNERE